MLEDVEFKQEQEGVCISWRWSGEMEGMEIWFKRSGSPHGDGALFSENLIFRRPGDRTGHAWRQIQYSTSSKFKGKTAKMITAQKNTTAKKVSKLKANKKYYVRIRTFKTVKVNGKKTTLCSNWSAVKTVRTK